MYKGFMNEKRKYVPKKKNYSKQKSNVLNVLGINKK